MNPPILEALAERLERMERENRRLKRVGAVLILGIGALVLMAQGKPSRVIEAERFVLRDARGKTRAVLGVEDRVTKFSLYDEDGDFRADLGVGPAVSTLGLFGKDKGSAVILSEAFPLEASLVFLKDKKMRSIVGVGVVGPALDLGDADGRSRASLKLAADGSPTLTLYDEDKKPRTILGHADLVTTRTGTVDRRPASSVVLFDKEGKVIWQAP